MIIEFHWTPEYIDEHMTLPRLYALSAEWRRAPPLRHVVARFVGYKPPAAVTDAPPELPEFED